MSVADEIKSKLDIVDYVQRYVPLKRAGRTYKAPCPFHSEKTPSFVVNAETQSWRCFGACSEGGDVFSFAQKMHGWTFSEALQELGKIAGVEVKQQTPEQRAQGERLDHLRGLLNAAADAYHTLLLDPNDAEAAAALKYAREKRGFTDETIRKFGVGFAPDGWHNMLDHLKLLGYTEEQIIETGLAIRNDAGRVYDRFRNRLMIPIRDERGRVTGFGARALNPDDNPKYLNSPQTTLFDKSRTLFGLDAAKRAIADTGTAVIVEGYMDVIQAHQAGFTNVVAQMGTAMTEAQLKLIAPRWAKKIILALDADAAGQNATMRGLEVARGTLQADYSGKLSVDIRVIQIPDAKDPDDLIREAPERWSELVEKAVPVADFVIDVEMNTLGKDASVQEVEALARRLTPILVASENQVYSRENIQKLLIKLNRLKYDRRMTGLNITETNLLEWADEQGRINRAKPPRPTPTPGPSSAGRGEQNRRDPALRRLERDLLEPPDLPPLDYDTAYIPEDDDTLTPDPLGHGELTADVRANTPLPKPGRASKEVAMEAWCLRMLFRQPEAYYGVNRTLRGLAGTNRALMDGPMGDWCADDFSHTEYRALMGLFQDGLKQDEMELLDFVRANAHDSLQSHLEAVMADDLEGVRNRVRNGLSADLTVAWNQSYRTIGSVDLNAELVEKALRLRINRLQREREELCFLQIDAQANGDAEAEAQFQRQIVLSSIAKGLIEAELQKQMSTLRE
jgi:DNA primase catalytic core